MTEQSKERVPPSRIIRDVWRKAVGCVGGLAWWGGVGGWLGIGKTANARIADFTQHGAPHPCQGLRGFYRGYLTSLSTNAPSSMMMWPLYGRFKSVLRQALIAAVPSVSPENEDPDTSRRWKGYLSVAIVAPFAGAMAGGTTALVTNPLDVIRTRQQLQEGVDLGFRTGAPFFICCGCGLLLWLWIVGCCCCCCGLLWVVVLGCGREAGGAKGKRGWIA